MENWSLRGFVSTSATSGTEHLNLGPGERGQEAFDTEENPDRRESRQNLY